MHTLARTLQLTHSILRGMPAQAKALGVSPGWYANNCHCGDHTATCEGTATCYRGDVQATVDFGLVWIDPCQPTIVIVVNFTRQTICFHIA